jgi:hypothetical protein
MSTLAIYASNFENLDNNGSSNTDNKQAHNRTQKNRIDENLANNSDKSDKVKSVLESIHSYQKGGDDDELANYNPPPNPTSIGSQRSSFKESMQGNINTNPNISINGQGQGQGQGTILNQPSYNNQPLPSMINNDNLDLNNYNNNYGNEDSNNNYYKKYVPNFSAAMFQSQQQKQNTEIKKNNNRYYNTPTTSQYPENIQNSLLIDKLNYMIHLLEEKQDERTNNVTEEVILYSFLGIFIIFIVDSFTRVGKYSR